jgi:hypothetical protein
MFRTVCIDKHFPIQNGMKRDDLAPHLLNFALEYTIWNVLEMLVGLKLSSTH